MSPITGRQLHGFTWTELSIAEEVITRVEEIGKKDKQTLTKTVKILNGSQGTSSWKSRRMDKILMT